VPTTVANERRNREGPGNRNGGDTTSNGSRHQEDGRSHSGRVEPSLPLHFFPFEERQVPNPTLPEGSPPFTNSFLNDWRAQPPFYDSFLSAPRSSAAEASVEEVEEEEGEANETSAWHRRGQENPQVNGHRPSRGRRGRGEDVNGTGPEEREDGEAEGRGDGGGNGGDDQDGER